jgi:hypothetical protein
MRTHDLPLADPGETGVFDLMAEALSAPACAAPDHEPASPSAPSPDARKVDRALVASGMWTWLGFVGASVFASAPPLVARGAIALAVALAVAGGALAAFAWRRAWTVFDHLDNTAATAEAPPAARPASASLDSVAAARAIAPAHPRTALAAP